MIGNDCFPMVKLAETRNFGGVKLAGKIKVGALSLIFIPYRSLIIRIFQDQRV
ncbi:hypothetical protein OZX74_03970 [Bifidobacterium sp. ESL0798]|uniref:hypothetical protein n=1 Tax=Bifidobacterium sp. ESL0798 TaxID=2983235 RepID=UPI0023F95CC7|nr:hypothetical protein [Bifidobacterium sp. ESL0798]WEV74683.1 hypothetical protein OZX74_03970 [Bifidobacterium sp. ESL0798]